MYALTVFTGPLCFQLLFKKEDRAREIQSFLRPDSSTALGSIDWIQLTDDFGHEMTIERKSLSGYIYEDMEQTKLAHVERALHQQRLQNLTHKTAAADPGLRMSSMMTPGMISPFPPSGPNSPMRGN